MKNNKNTSGITQQKLVDTETLAEVLGVCRQTVGKMVEDGKIPAVKINRVYRFDVSKVLEALKIENENEK